MCLPCVVNGEVISPALFCGIAATAPLAAWYVLSWSMRQSFWLALWSYGQPHCKALLQPLIELLSKKSLSYKSVMVHCILVSNMMTINSFCAQVTFMSLRTQSVKSMLGQPSNGDCLSASLWQDGVSWYQLSYGKCDLRSNQLIIALIIPSIPVQAHSLMTRWLNLLGICWCTNKWASSFQLDFSHFPHPIIPLSLREASMSHKKCQIWHLW